MTTERSAAETAAETASDGPSEEAPDSSSAAAPASTDSLDTTDVQSSPSPGDNQKRGWNRPRFWIAAVLAAALAGGWGLTVYYHGTSKTYRHASEENRASVGDLTKRLETMTQDRDANKARADQMQTREDAVKQREDRVQAREDAVKQREDAVGQAEKVQAQNTIHEGNWAVGVDIQPGTYRTKDPVSGNCYWEINSDANGDHIVANDIVTGGRPTVTLSGGQYFTTQRCGDWAKVS